MRNRSSVCSPLLRLLLHSIVGAAFLAFCAPALLAQCSAADDPDSYACQMQQTPPPPSTTQSPASPAVLSMQETPQQGTPQADRSTEASANGSLSSGANYTEQSLRNGAGLRRVQTLPPEPPTEFQRFVAASTGRMLPIYGARLFATLPASFGLLDQGPAPQDMVIGAGDELRIRIWGQINFSANLIVSREGEIYLPKAGAVHVAGLPFSAVAGHLRTALERIYRNFELSVDMGEIHSIQVYVTGQARQPGEYTVSALSTLVNAVFLCGGPSSAGSMRHVELRRMGKVLADFDLYALLVRGDKTGDVQLQAGDVLFIPSAGPQVALLGSVRLAAIYELRGQESIEELLNTAGGRTAIASSGRISVERIVDHERRRAFEMNSDAAGMAALLADGDIVRIDPIISSYRETVTLRGSLANPGRFLWHQGMRLSDLLPDRDSLISRDYWWRRTQLGLPAPEMAVPDGYGALKRELPDKTNTASTPGAQTAIFNPGAQTTISTPVAQTDWNFAVIERLNPATMTTSLLSFNLGKLVLDHDARQDLELQPGDVITVFSQDDIHPPIDEQTKYVRLEGEFVHAGVYSVVPGETLRSLVTRSGGLTAKAYLYGAEFYRKSTLALEQKSFNQYIDRLEHQLARSSVAAASVASDSSQVETQAGRIMSINQGLITRLRQLQPTGRIVLNLRPLSAGENELPATPLEDGDTLLVPSMPATIQVIGAVLNQNAFLYRGGRAGDYLHMAGGPNRDADRGQTFILRADGSVIGRRAGKSIFSSGFENTRIYPGDSVIVPEKRIKPGSMSAFLAWSQMFSQFALGAAAINELK
jgi:protein involved in polysaccharide export with SLBB domain